MSLAQDGGALWSDAAIRDTVAAIVSRSEYSRTLSESVWDRVLRWIGFQIGRLIDWIPQMNIDGKVVIAFAVVLVALLLARAVTSEMARRGTWQRDLGEFSARTPLDSWREAERLAAGGDYMSAAQALCASVLASCARRGEIKLHPSKTTGDYAREMKRRGAVSASGFQTFRSYYDLIVYDRQTCTAGEYNDLLARAQPILAMGRVA